jgi:hypothetical protein
MFGGPPAGYVPSAAEQDMAARLTASTQQQALAARLFESPVIDPARTTVLVPLALPGKAHGVWIEGQEVDPVPGLFVAFEGDTRTHNGRPSVTNPSQARALCVAAAQQWLDVFHGGIGQPAYAVIWDDGKVAVFEDYGRTPDEAAEAAKGYDHG